MRIPEFLLIAAAVILALPFGWGLGVIVAYAIAGPDFGQLPVGTIPVSLIAAIIFAVRPSISAQIRFTVMAVGTAVFVVLAWIGWPV
jgi:hypothetical protein